MKRVLLAGTLLGVLGVALFGAVHAVLIAPIWRRLLGGLPFAVPAGIATAWCFVELTRTGRLRVWPWRGLLFGGLLWLTILPMTLVGAGFRLSGLHGRLGNVELLLELATAAGSGLLTGLALGRSRRVALAMGLSVVALVLAMAGPIPVTNSRRALALFLSFLPIYLVAGSFLAVCLPEGAPVPLPSRSADSTKTGG